MSHDAEPLLKVVPADFVVREIPQVGPPEDVCAPHRSPIPGAYGEIELTKSGLTTFEALSVLAGLLEIPSSAIGYSGLKDEDGITTQFLTVPVGSAPSDAVDWQDGERWMTARPRGQVCAPKRVGELFGNAFRVVVRRMPTGWTGGSRKVTVPVVNYYDTQRFGVPGGPLLTDRIGESLIQGRHEEALRLVEQSMIPESAAAAGFSGDPAEFFAALDQRVVAFWHSAYYSSLWNAEVRRLLTQATAVDVVARRGREYAFPADPHALRTNAILPLDLPYRTARAGERDVEVSARVRSTTMWITFHLSEPEPDDLHPGKERLTIQFMLPAGAYATMAVHQLLRAEARGSAGAEPLP